MFNFSALRKMRCKGTENYWVETKKSGDFLLYSTKNIPKHPKKPLLQSLCC